MTWQQGVLIYIGIGVILFTHKTTRIPRKEWYKVRNEFRKEFSNIPESLHPLSSLLASVIFLAVPAFLTLIWPKYIYNMGRKL